jgi:AraC-like DNA-binding protein
VWNVASGPAAERLFDGGWHNFQLRPGTTTVAPVAPESQRIERTIVAIELDDVSSAFGHKAVRLGLGNGPNLHREIGFDGVRVRSASIGFPNAGELTIGDDQVAVALCVRAPQWALWSGHDFMPGTMMCWGPGSEGTWLNPEGLSAQIAYVDALAIHSMAETLKERIRLPRPGEVVRLPKTASVLRLGMLLASFGDPLDTSVVLPDSPTELLVALTHVFAENARRPSAAGVRRLDSRLIVRTCVDHADEVEGRPSVPELCLAAYVSERRLRKAFSDVFDMAPSTYFRLRSLNLARSQLLRGGTSTTVTEVASDLGWTNLGRFAQYYRSVFQETPSHTLATARRAARTPMRTRSA